MAISGITPGSIYATNSQPLQSMSQHKQNAHPSSSLSDIDAQGSSIASAPSSTGKVGSKVNFTV
jgi:hypothetical protein